MWGEPWSRIYRRLAQPPGTSAPDAGGGSAATRATSHDWSNRSGASPRPTWVARLADDRPGTVVTDLLPESGNHRRVEGQPRRKLHQHRPALCSQGSDFSEKAAQRLLGPPQAPFVRDDARRLDGETKPSRRGGRPSGVGRRLVRPVERRVDLHGGKAGGVARELARPRREPIRVFPWDRPARASDPYITALHVPCLLSSADAHPSPARQAPLPGPYTALWSPERRFSTLHRTRPCAGSDHMAAPSPPGRRPRQLRREAREVSRGRTASCALNQEQHAVIADPRRCRKGLPSNGASIVFKLARSARRGAVAPRQPSWADPRPR